MRKSLFTGRLRITLVLASHTVAPLISESLLGNTLVNGNSPKVSGYSSLFLYIFSFDIRCSSRKFTHVSIYPKMITDAVYLISSALENS